MIIPDIQTERLILREFRLDDGIRLCQIEGSPEMVRYQLHEAFTAETASQYATEAMSAQSADPRTWIELAACLTDGTFIGRVGCSLQEGEAWIWYVIGEEYQGRGYASEAVLRLVSLLGELEIHSVNLECDPQNIPSWRLAERLGFTLVGESENSVEVKGKWCGSKVYAKTLAISTKIA